MAPLYPETFFVQTDPSFCVVLQSLEELRKQGGLRVIYSQHARIDGIESNNLKDPMLFGSSHPQYFARTASSVIRMCMLKATGIEDNLWPKIGTLSQERNEKKCHFKCEVPPNGANFCLENGSKDKARRYWSKYDQLHPHFLIQDKLSKNYGKQAELNSMMVIIRKEFKEVVEIFTTFTVTCHRYKEQTDENKTKFTYKFDHPCVHVKCNVLEIDPGNHGNDRNEATQFLKELIMMFQKFEVKNFDSKFNACVKKEIKDKIPLSGMTDIFHKKEEQQQQREEQVKQEQQKGAEDDDEEEISEEDFDDGDDDDKKEEGPRVGEEERKGQKKKEKKKE